MDKGLDYYELMALLLRARRLTLVSAIVLGALPAWAQEVAPASEAPPPTPEVAPDPDLRSELNAELFYELLVGEMSWARGDYANAISLLMEAARSTQDARLYRRAADIALQSRAGQRALGVAQSWQQAFPESREANRYVLQILLALNRVSDTSEPLRRELAATPAPAKPAAYMAIVQLYSRVSDKALAAAVVEDALQADLQDPATGPAAWAMLGHLRLAAEQKQLAQQAVERSHALTPYNGAAALLALELMESGNTQVEPIVRGYLDNTPSSGIRMAYARVLMAQQRHSDAREQLEAVLMQSPELPDAWLAMASLQAQTSDWEGAQRSLRSFVPLAERIPDTGMRQQALTQAALLGARAALPTKDYATATTWLDRIPASENTLETQSLRALVLAKQGRLPQARALIRAVPARDATQEKHKRRAEVQLLREAGADQEAYLLQLTLHQQDPQDNDMAYDAALLAERAGKFETMERILREIMVRQPDYFHAANALGYSLAERGIRLDEARTLVEQALHYAPEDPFITDSLAWVEFRAGNRTRALQLLEQAYAQRNDVEIAAHLGEVLWSLGHKDRALEVWRQALQRQPDNDTLQATLRRLNVQP